MAKTIKDLAKELNCSYEAVRKQTKRYAKELGEHIYVQHKTQYLDDYACDFIRNKRTESPVVFSRLEYDEAVEILKKKYTELLEKQSELRDEKEKLQGQINDLRLLESENNRKVKEAETNAKNAHQELEAFKEMSVIDFIKFKFKRGKKQDGKENS